MEAVIKFLGAARLTESMCAFPAGLRKLGPVMGPWCDCSAQTDRWRSALPSTAPPSLDPFALRTRCVIGWVWKI